MEANPKILITGAAGYYGSAIARRVAQAGWRPILADRDGDGVQALAQEIGGDWLALDVTDRDAVRRAVTAMAPLDGLVNAAGGPPQEQPFSDSDSTSWHAIIDLHFRAVLNCIHAVLPGMLTAKRGSIVSLVACEGLRSDLDSPLYSVAKAAVIVLTEQLVRECQPASVRVNTLLLPHRAAPIPASKSPALAVAEAAEFLLSDRSYLTSGACLDASGGWALH
jgi:2-hydroxycyclohexanecarboxyl-CoA dehydrogenase